MVQTHCLIIYVSWSETNACSKINGLGGIVPHYLQNIAHIKKIIRLSLPSARAVARSFGVILYQHVSSSDGASLFRNIQKETPQPLRLY